MYLIRGLALLLLGVVVGIALVVGMGAGLGLFMAQPIASGSPVAAQPIAPQAAQVTATTPTSDASPAITPTAAATATALATVSPVPVTTPATAAQRGRLLGDEQTLVDLYDRVSPAVVNITNRRAASEGVEFPRSGAGSGVVFDERGYILTNNHVVDDARTLEVTLHDGTNVPAQLVGRDPGNDLAVVKVDVPPERLHIATFGDSDELRPGQLAIAIGNPFGLERTITTGVVSSVGRTRSSQGQRPIRNMIQIDAPINPGNSGGPLLNSVGEVVGINTAIESPVRGSVGIGFAVPINTAKLFLPQMLAGERVQHPWLGITGAPMTPATALELGVDLAEGVYVAEVVPDAPAARAGIRGAGRSPTGDLARGGDVIFAIDGQPVRRTEDISNYLDRKRVGEVVEVDVMREGRRETIKVMLGEWPEAQAARTPGQP